ncbi:MAG: hypothetical protein E7160_02725 [Firmicutes bacterium]|nr:hypothetical protein [Bacillota bacterium]
MTEKELVQVRKEVEQQMNITEKKIEFYKELKVLEKDPKIKRYLKLKYELIPDLEENFSLPEVYINILKEYGKITEEPNNLYLYLGVENKNSSKYLKYINIETGNLKKVSYYLMKDFEDNNNIVRINGYSNAIPTEEQINQVINYYYQELYKTSQEEATIKTVTKTKF